MPVGPLALTIYVQVMLVRDPALEQDKAGKMDAVSLTLPSPSGGATDIGSFLFVQSLPDPTVHRGTIEVPGDARCFATTEVHMALAPLANRGRLVSTISCLWRGSEYQDLHNAPPTTARLLVNISSCHAPGNGSDETRIDAIRLSFLPPLSRWLRCPPRCNYRGPGASICMWWE